MAMISIAGIWAAELVTKKAGGGVIYIWFIDVSIWLIFSSLTICP